MLLYGDRKHRMTSLALKRVKEMGYCRSAASLSCAASISHLVSGVFGVIERMLW